MSLRDLSGAAKGALILGIIGLVFSINFTNTSNINGVVTCSHTDIAKIALGALAIIVGASGEIQALRGPAASRLLNMGASGAGVLLGIYNLLTGLSIINSPC